MKCALRSGERKDRSPFRISLLHSGLLPAHPPQSSLSDLTVSLRSGHSSASVAHAVTSPSKEALCHQDAASLASLALCLRLCAQLHVLSCPGLCSHSAQVSPCSEGPLSFLRPQIQGLLLRGPPCLSCPKAASQVTLLLVTLLVSSLAYLPS